MGLVAVVSECCLRTVLNCAFLPVAGPGGVDMESLGKSVRWFLVELYLSLLEVVGAVLFCSFPFGLITLHEIPF